MSILAFSQSQARGEKEKEEQDRVRQEHIQEQHRQECLRIKKMLQDANEVQTCDAFEDWVIGLPINSEMVFKLQLISNKDTLETIMNAVIPGNLSYPILSYPILSYPILSYPILSYPLLYIPILDSIVRKRHHSEVSGSELMQDRSKAAKNFMGLKNQVALSCMPAIIKSLF